MLNCWSWKVILSLGGELSRLLLKIPKGRRLSVLVGPQGPSRVEEEFSSPRSVAIITLRPVPVIRVKEVVGLSSFMDPERSSPCREVKQERLVVRDSSACLV